MFEELSVIPPVAFAISKNALYFSEDVSGTLRNYVFGKEMAINGIKILPENRREPSYIGTAYVNLKDIEVLNEKFNNLWELAKPLN